MIPEADQIFTEVELSTLEKAINETTVRNPARKGCAQGGGEGNNFHTRLPLLCFSFILAWVVNVRPKRCQMQLQNSEEQWCS